MDSTGDRNMMEFMFPGGFAMAQMGRPGLSSQQKEELWERWKTGQSLSDIGRALGKHAASVFGVLLSKGGIAPTARTRSRLSLSLQDREEISRGLVSGLSMRKIAEELGRSPSTISRVAFILTSRPTDELAREFQHLSRFELASFSPEQQSELAARWLGQRASDFERAFDRFANGELGGTPLLLTIAAIVYRDAGELPLRRSELYRQFVQSTWKEAFNKGATEELGTRNSRDCRRPHPKMP